MGIVYIVMRTLPQQQQTSVNYLSFCIYHCNNIISIKITVNNTTAAPTTQIAEQKQTIPNTNFLK